MSGWPLRDTSSGYRRARRHAMWLALLGAGCTTILSIDGDYTNASSAAGSAGRRGDAGGKGGAFGEAEMPASGGSPRAGGEPSAGGEPGAAGGARGMGGAGGAAGAGGADCTVTGCITNEKCCGAPEGFGQGQKACSYPAPIIGCGLGDCTKCPAPPAQGVSTCVNDKCTVICNDGFALTTKGDCVQSSAGGAA